MALVMVPRACTVASHEITRPSKRQGAVDEIGCRRGSYSFTNVGITAYNKGCAQDRECSESGNLVYIGVYGSRVQCCSSSLCNVNGAAHARLTLQLLGFSAALLYLVGMVTV
ncbi:uncharacterized protein LOC121315177 isoform X2 [Polyodon spathula]|uniref:uncharacterized protein LOC121315177 isoform X2 n=1 Tax=Polyodon spathula TaxID=7913 RepID=UPI001B7DF6BA|nr:uncharacterized protein LOC121315177 isoform X2 [Polyodon spathula]